MTDGERMIFVQQVIAQGDLRCGRCSQPQGTQGFMAGGRLVAVASCERQTVRSVLRLLDKGHLWRQIDLVAFGPVLTGDSDPGEYRALCRDCATACLLESPAGQIVCRP